MEGIGGCWSAGRSGTIEGVGNGNGGDDWGLGMGSSDGCDGCCVRRNNAEGMKSSKRLGRRIWRPERPDVEATIGAGSSMAVYNASIKGRV